MRATSTEVLGHGWLCHPTSPKGQFSENLNFSSGIVIREVKVQTLINFYDSKYQKQKQVSKIATFPKTETGSLGDTYLYADWQSLQWLPVTPTFASPVQWDNVTPSFGGQTQLDDRTADWIFKLIWLNLGVSNWTKLSPNLFLQPVPLFELLSRAYWAIPTTTCLRPSAGWA